MRLLRKLIPLLTLSLAALPVLAQDSGGLDHAGRQYAEYRRQHHDARRHDRHGRARRDADGDQLW